MAGCDALDLQVLGGVSSEFEHFGGEVFKDGSDVDGGLGANAHLLLGVVLQETLDATAWELRVVLALFCVEQCCTAI